MHQIKVHDSMSMPYGPHLLVRFSSTRTTPIPCDATLGINNSPVEIRRHGALMRSGNSRSLNHSGSGLFESCKTEKFTSQTDDSLMYKEQGVK